MEPFLACPICGEPIGVYEPALVLTPTSARTTSLAREPDLALREAGVTHRDCAYALGFVEAPAAQRH